MGTEPNLIKGAFADVFGPGYTPKNYTEHETNITLTLDANNVYVCDSVFHYCSSSSDGGAIYCSNSVYNLLVERSSFISCRALNTFGGGICFRNQNNGQCALNKICGFNCSVISSNETWGQCARMSAKDDVKAINHVNDSSISHSLKTSTYQHNVLSNGNGNITCPSVNITNNECYCNTAYYSWPRSSTSSHTCCLSYGSIVNNTSITSYSCIWLSNPDSIQRIDTCNILNNQQTDPSSGTIYSRAKLLIKDSCILGNSKVNLVVYQSSHSMTMSNCTIDNDIISNKRYTGNVEFDKPVESAFINALSHIITQHCDSYFDSYWTLTGKLNVPTQRAKRRELFPSILFLQIHLSYFMCI
jgi:hypothetical protein